MRGRIAVQQLTTAKRLTSRSPKAVVFIVISGLVATVPGLLLPMLMRVFVNQVVAEDNSAWVVPVIIGLLACCAVIGLLTWMNWRVLGMVAVRLSAGDSATYAWHSLRIPLSEVDRLSPGGLTGRANRLQAQAFQAGLMVPLALVNILSLFVYLAAMMLLDWRIGLAALVVVLLSSVVSLILLAERRRLQRQGDAATLDLFEHSTKVVTTIETIKASAAEHVTFDRWMQVRTHAAETTSSLGRQSQRLGMVAPLTQSMGIAAVLSLGTVMVFVGQIDLGTLVAAQGLLLAILVPAGQLVWLGVLLESVSSAQDQVDEVIACPVDVEVAEGGPPGALESTPLGLAVESLVFGYDPLGPALFEGLSLTVETGRWLAVVGASGSGKSTLARLVVGEVQPWSGAVLLGGVPRLSIPRRERCRLIGYVPQTPSLMPGTILDNVRLFDESLSIERVKEAMEVACILRSVEQRPGGVFTEVGPSGHGFSGGEIQRLAIARALVQSPRVLVLDEATSALDPIVEADLEHNLRGLGLTCLFVAHRISTVRDADSIVVLSRGAIEAMGTFRELAAGGHFEAAAHA